MKRKQIVLSLICLFLGVCVSAQIKHEFSLSAGGGISTLNYKPSIGEANLFGVDNLGGTAGIGYAFFFTDNVGIGTGGELALYRSKFIFSDDITIGSNTIRLNDYEETQQALLVNIPLTLQIRAGNHHRFYMDIGAKVGFPVFADNNMYKIKNGYSIGINPKNDGTTEKLDFNFALMATAEIGAQWKFSRVTSLYTGIYADFGVNDIMQDADKSWQFVDPVSATKPDNSVLVSSIKDEPMVKDNVAPFALGLKLRLAFTAGSNKIKVNNSKETRSDRKAREKEEKKVVVQREKDKQKVKEANTNVTNPERLSNVELEKELKEEVSKQAEEYSYWEEYFRAQNVQGKTAYEKAIEEIQKVIGNFAINEIQLTPSQKADLDKKANLLKIYPEFSVICVGYTCDLGNDYVNMGVGMARAMVAKQYLVNKGISENRIMTLSKGKKYPVVENDTEEHRMQNRRVEFFVLE